MSPRGARAIRGAAIAAFAMLVASLAHTIGGGTPPGVLALALAMAFSAPLAMVIAGERMSLPRAAVAALVAQAALHLLYSIGTPARGAASVVAHAHGSGVPLRIDAGGLAVVVDHGHALGMPLAHVAAAAATVVALALLGRAARAVSVAFGTAVRGIRLLVSVLAGAPVATNVRHVVPAARRQGPPALALVLLSSLRHRGPPASWLAA